MFHYNKISYKIPGANGTQQSWQVTHLGQGQSDIKPTTQGPRCYCLSLLGQDSGTTGLKGGPVLRTLHSTKKLRCAG